MGNTKRDKEYLGVDTNVLVAFLVSPSGDQSSPRSPAYTSLLARSFPRFPLRALRL